jgi:hypothetical protein
MVGNGTKNLKEMRLTPTNSGKHHRFIIHYNAKITVNGKITSKINSKADNPQFFLDEIPRTVLIRPRPEYCNSSIDKETTTAKVNVLWRSEA